jgi:hypothetical protein
MDRTDHGKRYEAAQLATKNAEMIRWLDECPDEDGQPYEETAARHIRGRSTALFDLCVELGEHIIAERVREIRDGEVEPMDPEWEAKAWEELARDINPTDEVA